MIGVGFIPEGLNRSIVDEVITVTVVLLAGTGERYITTSLFEH